MDVSICGVFDQKNCISGISRVREGGQGQGGGSGTYGVAVIVSERWWICRTPMKNQSGLAALLRGKRRGKHRGGCRD
jgi:hypothetical protein